MHRQKATRVNGTRNKSKRITQMNVGNKRALSPGQRA